MGIFIVDKYLQHDPKRAWVEDSGNGGIHFALVGCDPLTWAPSECHVLAKNRVLPARAVRPTIAFMGVRMSCDMVERKSVFALFADSASI